MLRLADKYDHLDLFSVRKHFSYYFCLAFYSSLYCTALLVLITFLLVVSTMQGYSQVVGLNREYDQVLDRWQGIDNTYL